MIDHRPIIAFGILVLIGFAIDFWQRYYKK
jgi:hypothetical protein